jgi:flagellar operon protein (TIGR03826 family)
MKEKKRGGSGMEFRNCPVCGNLFNYVSRYMCPTCIEVEEKEFETVRKYVRDNEGATIFSVSQATGVNEEKIIRFLKEGRLIARGMVLEGELTCERCGKVVTEGTMCETCKADIFRDFNRGMNVKAPETTPHPNVTTSRNRMHISDIVRRK